MGYLPAGPKSSKLQAFFFPLLFWSFHSNSRGPGERQGLPSTVWFMIKEAEISPLPHPMEIRMPLREEEPLPPQGLPLESG